MLKFKEFVKIDTKKINILCEEKRWIRHNITPKEEHAHGLFIRQKKLLERPRQV